MFKKYLNELAEQRKKSLATFDEEIANNTGKWSDDDLKEFKDARAVCQAELDKLEEMLEHVDEPADDQQGAKRFNPFDTMELKGLGAASFETKNTNGGRENKMENSAEIRALQKFVAHGGTVLNDTEKRALDTSGAAAVIPVNIYNELITDTKYSDLLHRAKVFNEGGAGKLYIPIAASVGADWHEETAEGESSTPTLSKLELGGYEILGLVSMSAAVDSMTEATFKQNLLETLSAEVVETLENAFVNGDGDGKPTGLAKLTWTSANTVTASATNGITYKDVAKALGKLPQKYARNAILLMNADTAYNTIAAADDEVARPIYNISDAAQRMLGHEVVISEHVDDDIIFVVDPTQLYVRFAMPIKLESDRSSGFTSASVNLRALTVADAAWNPSACVKIEKADEDAE